MRMIEYQDVRPDGTVLARWVCPEDQPSAMEYGAIKPVPPYETQRRDQGGEWEAFLRVRADGFTELA